MIPSTLSRVAMAAALLALGGCTTIQVDVPPVSFAVPGQFDAVGEPTSGDPAIDIARWWKGFGDPALSELVEAGLRHNSDVRIALARLAEARAYLDVAESTRQPAVEAGASVSRGKQDATTPSAAGLSLPGPLPLPIPIQTGDLPSANIPWGNARSHGVVMAWELDVFGGLRAQSDMVASLVLGAQEQVHGARLLVAGDIASNYIEARAAMQRMALLDEAIGVATRLKAYAQGRFNAGQATSSDVDRAEIEWLHAQSKKEPLQALLHRHLKRLAVLTGRTPQSIQVLPVSAKSLVAPPLPPRLPGQVLERRPDVRGAAYKLRAQASKLGATKSELFPKFYLGLSSVIGRAYPDDADSGGFSLQRIGVGVRLPIFHGGRIRANIAANQAQLDGLAVEYEKAILSALEDVENAYVAKKAFDSQHRHLVRTAELARRVADQREALFMRGQDLLQPALEARAKAFEREDERVRADTDHLLYTVQLYKALGGGWRAEEPQVEAAKERVEPLPSGEEVRGL